VAINYRKVDAALAAALDRTDPAGREPLVLFVHLDPDLTPDQVAALAAAGVNTSAGRAIATASLTPRQIEAVTGYDCVRFLRLSSSRRPLG
jgi:hypothetical protein